MKTTLGATMKNTTLSPQCFCAEVLLDDVKHYKSDLFITYGQMLEMKLGESAIVMTRECGVEFISAKTSEPLYTFDAWKRQAVRMFEVKRGVDGAFHLPSVEYVEIGEEIALGIVMEWEKNKFRTHLFHARYTDEVYTYEEMLERYNLDDSTAFDRLASLTESGKQFYLFNA